MKHILLTRWNVNWSPHRGGCRLDDDYLRNRVELFERFTLPSVQHQTVAPQKWLAWFDAESPAWLRERIESWGIVMPIFLYGYEWEISRSDMRLAEWTAVTRLDNDDMLAVDFCERIQQEASEKRGFVQFTEGCVKTVDGSFIGRHSDNSPFATEVVAPEEALTLYTINHSKIGKEIPAKLVGGSIAWCCVVHGENLLNHDGLANREMMSDEMVSERFPAMNTLSHSS